jgi:hypothetical protein
VGTVIAKAQREAELSRVTLPGVAQGLPPLPGGKRSLDGLFFERG